MIFDSCYLNKARSPHSGKWRFTKIWTTLIGQSQQNEMVAITAYVFEEFELVDKFLVGMLPGGEFKEGQSQTPDISLDAKSASASRWIDSFRRHVPTSAGVTLRHGIFQFARYPIIADLQSVN